jgi:hypothetical protein
MPEHQTTQNAAKERFWERFIERTRNNGVKESAIRCHIRRAEAYLEIFPNKRLRQHTLEDVNGYLEQAGRPDRIETKFYHDSARKHWLFRVSSRSISTVQRQC